MDPIPEGHIHCPAVERHHVTSDRKPPDFQLATPAKREAYIVYINEYAFEWIESYRGLSVVNAGLIWADFTTDFSITALENDERHQSESSQRCTS
jgi:hypothetical protein